MDENRFENLEKEYKKLLSNDKVLDYLILVSRLNSRLFEYSFTKCNRFKNDIAELRKQIEKIKNEPEVKRFIELRNKLISELEKMIEKDAERYIYQIPLGTESFRLSVLTSLKKSNRKKVLDEVVW